MAKTEAQGAKRRLHLHAPSQPLQVPLYNPPRHTHSVERTRPLPVKVGYHATSRALQQGCPRRVQYGGEL